MNTSIKILLFMVISAAIIYGFTANTEVNTQTQNEEFIELAYSDRSPSTYGVNQINEVLRAVGVRVSTLPLPEAAGQILETSQSRALTTAEADELISIFSLDRQGLLEEIQRAGRVPAALHGGSLSTSEIGVPPYPKVYDMKSLSPEMTIYLQEKFGKLHVNSSEDGVGIDEVMTIVSGGPYTWFFVLPGNVVGKLTFGHVGKSGHAWRVSYPGLIPHGGFFDAEYGLVVAYAHGPEHFVMRYKEPNVQGAETLGKNPWINFSKETPQLLTRR
ncbi:hypothetical protein [Desulfospira joergensenii]|uniref:hypothetical protein n=1 Tax=Desulfospira joergensenii TaxID=53329 RepID=UPI0003B3C070|nr:hypothetical protein [Desulfospira joergensenii]